MHSWFQTWMDLTESFLSDQFKNYRSRFQSPPAKMFLMGGSSNAKVLQTSVERLLREDAFFCDTELVPLGTEDRFAYLPSESKSPHLRFIVQLLWLMVRSSAPCHALCPVVRATTGLASQDKTNTLRGVISMPRRTT